VREDIQRLVLLNRWKSGVCAAASTTSPRKGGIAYSFEDIQVTSWSDRGAPPSRHRRDDDSREESGRLSG